MTAKPWKRRPRRRRLPAALSSPLRTTVSLPRSRRRRSASRRGRGGARRRSSCSRTSARAGCSGASDLGLDRRDRAETGGSIQPGSGATRARGRRRRRRCRKRLGPTERRGEQPIEMRSGTSSSRVQATAAARRAAAVAASAKISEASPVAELTLKLAVGPEERRMRRPVAGGVGRERQAGRRQQIPPRAARSRAAGLAGGCRADRPEGDRDERQQDER